MRGPAKAAHYVGALRGALSVHHLGSESLAFPEVDEIVRNRIFRSQLCEIFQRLGRNGRWQPTEEGSKRFALFATFPVQADKPIQGVGEPMSGHL